MEEVRLYKTPWRAIKLLVMIIPFVVMGIVFIIKADAQWMGWLSISFFGGLGIPLLFSIYSTSVRKSLSMRMGFGTERQKKA